MFTCLQKQCRRKLGSVRAVRACVVRKGAEKTEKAEEVKGKPVEKKVEAPRAGDMLFGSGLGTSTNANPFAIGGSTAANPFAMGGSSKAAANPFGNPFGGTPKSAPEKDQPEAKVEQTKDTPVSPAEGPSKLAQSFADTLKLNNTQATTTKEDEPQFYGPAEPWPSPIPNCFPNYYLDAEYEQLDAKPESIIPENIPTEEDVMADASGGGGEDWGGYEKSTLDKTFQKFADRVAENPEQVLR